MIPGLVGGIAFWDQVNLLNTAAKEIDINSTVNSSFSSSDY